MMGGESLVLGIWYGSGWAARATRVLLTPVSWLFGAVVRRRNARYDTQPQPRAPLPALSVGNLTVGGTGKTPVAAWCVAELRARGASPAIVLRGVGDDEWRVHTLLNPGVPIVVAPDRLAGMREAKARGADCVVLDDAFQHRRAPRTVDLVLVSADTWTGRARLLPAGPFRESLPSLRRADVVAVTTKAATAEQVAALIATLNGVLAEPGDRRPAPVVLQLAPGAVRSAMPLVAMGGAIDGSVDGAVDGERAMAEGTEAVSVSGVPVCLVSGIGNPDAFMRQVRGLGARMVVELRFADHHAYGAADVARIQAAADGAHAVLCTLKDAVKLAPLWPRAGLPLWYLSQSVVVEQGADILERAIQQLLAAREPSISTAG